MHILQPKHIKLNEDEKNKILSEHNISIAQIPIIKHTDSAIQNLDVNKGDLIKILRKVPEKYDYTYFRVVV